MSSLLPSVTTAALVPGTVTIDSKTITLWVQLQVGAGVYQTGGIPAGIKALANSLTVDATAFLQSYIASELQVPNTGTFYTYKYIPTLDYLQIFQTQVINGVQGSDASSPGLFTSELSSSAIIPAGVLNDVVVGQFIYNRL